MSSPLVSASSPVSAIFVPANEEEEYTRDVIEETQQVTENPTEKHFENCYDDNDNKNKEQQVEGIVRPGFAELSLCGVVGFSDLSDPTSHKNESLVSAGVVVSEENENNHQKFNNNEDGSTASNSSSSSDDTSTGSGSMEDKEIIEEGEGEGEEEGNKETEQPATANPALGHPTAVFGRSARIPSPASQTANATGGTLLEKAIKCLDNIGIVHRKQVDIPTDERTIISFATQLENCNLDNRLDIQGGERQIAAMYAISPLRIPRSKRAEAMEFFTRANYNVLVGCFEMDLNDGEFRYRVSSNFQGAIVTEETIRCMYLIAANLMGRYFGGLMNVIYAGKSPIEAVSECVSSAGAAGASSSVSNSSTAPQQ